MNMVSPTSWIFESTSILAVSRLDWKSALVCTASCTLASIALKKSGGVSTIEPKEILSGLSTQDARIAALFVDSALNVAWSEG